MKYFDISYLIDQDTVIYPGNPEFCLERVQDISRGDSANVSRIIIGSHTGTHIDAPSHFVKDGATLDEIPLERMNGIAKVIDATARKDVDVDFLKRIDIEREDILLFKTDNSTKWACDKVLDDYVTLTYEAADYLAHIGIKMIGIDYMTIERPKNARIVGKSVHGSLLKNSVLVLESLRLKGVLAGVYELICAPLNIRGIDGCPVRALLTYVSYE